MLPNFRHVRVGLLAAIALASASAGSEPLVVRQGTPHEAFFGMTFDAGLGIAVGTGGVITSKDGGATWQPEAVPGRSALFAVASRDGRALAVGQNGTILSRDASGHWTAADAGSQSRLFAVDIDSGGSALAVGAFGTILCSGDGGAHWSSCAPDWSKGLTEQGAQPHLYGVSFTRDGAAIVVGEFGLVLRTSDAGRTWSVTHRGESSLFAVDVASDGVGYAVGQDGEIVRTADAGLTWSKLDSGSRANLLAVRRLSSGHIVVCAMREMLESADGSTWRRLEWGDFSSGWYSTVAAADNGSAVPLVAGYSGRIVKLDR